MLEIKDRIVGVDILLADFNTIANILNPGSMKLIRIYNDSNDKDIDDYKLVSKFLNEASNSLKYLALYDLQFPGTVINYWVCIREKL